MIEYPGFVDLQVNGFVGVDFSDPTLAEADIVRAYRAVLARGTAGFLATMVTSSLETYRRNIPMLVDVMHRDEFYGRVLGLHLEGPFISSRPGAVGAHNPAYVQPPDLALLETLLDLGKNEVRLITVAAELPGIEALIDVACVRNVTTSIGHSLFTAEDLQRVSPYGAVGLTHLGNGLPNMLPRHPNPIWAGLADENYMPMIIADGHHLPASTVKVMARAKGAQHFVVVSDASPVAGLPPGEYDVLGNHAVLEPSGRLYNPEKQCLVGSTATMLECMNFLASLNLFEYEDLIHIGFTNPLQLTGFSTAEILRFRGRMTFADGRFVLLEAG